MAADWHELMILRHIMWPSIAHDNDQLDPRCSTTDIPPPQSATWSLHSVVRKLLLIFHPAEDRRLSWPEHTVGQQLAQGCFANDPGEIWTCNVKVTSPVLHHQNTCTHRDTWVLTTCPESLWSSAADGSQTSDLLIRNPNHYTTEPHVYSVCNGGVIKMLLLLLLKLKLNKAVDENASLSYWLLAAM